MINYITTQRLREQFGVSEEIFEKDFLIELLLNFISKDKDCKELLIFRSVTSIKKMFYPEFRFSEDLDFIVRQNSDLEKIYNKFQLLLEKINANFPAELKIESFSYSQSGHLQIFISYNIVSEIRLNKNLKIDIVEDNIILNSKKKRIIFTYANFKNLVCYMKTYDLESIVVEKIGRILGVVDEPRDLWDLEFLLGLSLNIKK